MFKFSQRSEDNLNGVHPDLVKVVRLALQKTTVDFSVLEGVRTLERQKKLLEQGVSKTLNSRHITGHAVDLGPVPLDWKNLAGFKAISEAMKSAAKELGISIEWGGDWKKFVDCPHFQLSRRDYP